MISLEKRYSCELIRNFDVLLLESYNEEAYISVTAASQTVNSHRCHIVALLA